MIRPQRDFPFLDLYREHFAIDGNTVFALGEDIYTDNPLTEDLLVHELVHLDQQKRVGVKEWVYDFLYVPQKRLEYEVEAYRKQIASIKDGNRRTRVWLQSATNLSSALYGNVISREAALKALKV